MVLYTSGSAIGLWPCTCHRPPIASFSQLHRIEISIALFLYDLCASVNVCCLINIDLIAFLPCLASLEALSFEYSCWSVVKSIFVFSSASQFTHLSNGKLDTASIDSNWLMIFGNLLSFSAVHLCQPCW